MADTRENLTHVALLYRDQPEFVAQVMGFACAGMAGGEPVLLALPGDSIRLFKELIRENPADLTCVDMNDVGRNPARIIPEVMAFRDKYAGSRVRYIGQAVWPGRSDSEIGETVRYESLLNEVFATAPMTIFCLYDIAKLGPSGIDDAEHTHPEIIENGLARPGSGEIWRGGVPPDRARPLGAPPPGTVTLEYRAKLGPVRDLVRDFAEHAGLSEDRATDLVIAVNELAANTLAHTAGTGVLRIWSTGNEVLCEIYDGGWITDPLAGHLRHEPESRGHGLWLVNQVCDLVELRTGPGGTSTRVHMSLKHSRRG